LRGAIERHADQHVAAGAELAQPAREPPGLDVERLVGQDVPAITDGDVRWSVTGSSVNRRRDDVVGHCRPSLGQWWCQRLTRRGRKLPPCFRGVSSTSGQAPRTRVQVIDLLGASGRLRLGCAVRTGWGTPGRRLEPTLAVERHPNVALARRDVTIPELARHLLVALIEALAVVRELAASHLAPEAEPDLPEPVGVGERLTRGADEVGLAAAENALGLLERMDASAGHDGRHVTGRANGAANRGGQRHVPSERPPLVAEHRRHALVAGDAGVGIDGLADLRLARVLEAPALGDRQIAGTSGGELDAVERRVVDPAPTGDDIVA